MNKLRWMSLLLCAWMVIISGCTDLPGPVSAGEETTNAVTEVIHAEPKEDLYIEVSALGNLNYFQNHKLGMKLAGEALDVRTEYIGPDEFDLDAMKVALRGAIDRNPAGIVVVGFDNSLNKLVDQAVNTGIPVVTVDSDLPDSKRIAFVGTGNYQAGYEGGSRLAELLGGVGKVAIMSVPGQPNLDERLEGYLEALRGYPNIKVVEVVNTKSDPDVGARELGELLKEHTDLAGIGCTEASGGTASVQVLTAAGKEGRIRVVAMDNTPDVVKGIEDGIISASVVQQTALMPFYAVQILYNLNHDPVLPDLINRQQQLGTPIMIDTGVVIIDKHNYKQMLQEDK